MSLQNQILFGGETPVLEKSPVESFPVITGKKLSVCVPEIVGDFSLIPTSWIERIQFIGTVHPGVREKGIRTRSAERGWRLVARW